MSIKRKCPEDVSDPTEKKVQVGNESYPAVSIIVALYNAEGFIEECLESLLVQTYQGSIEVSIHDDASTDASMSVLQAWLNTKEDMIKLSKVSFVVSQGESNNGAGAARNAAVLQSSGTVLIIQDADDIAYPTRVELQVAALLKETDSHEGRCVLVGSQFVRLPCEATHHYSQWANGLTRERLWCERFRECTLIHPTWCYLRTTFDLVGGYPSQLAEDLTFFLTLGGINAVFIKVDEPLVVYRHVGNSLVSKTPRKHLLRLRVEAFEKQVLSQWCNLSATDHEDEEPTNMETSRGSDFVVWGSGRDGRDFVNLLQLKFRNRVRCMLDVDEKKIGNPYVNGRVKGSKPLPVVHWRDAPEGLPVVLCVSMGRTAGVFEANVAELAATRNMVETKDYWHFI